MGMSGDTALVLAKNYVKKTLQGQGALKGKDGFSPIIEENADNTDEIYKLDITTANSEFTTPNLRGKDGEGSGGGETNVIESISVNGSHISPDENKNVDITVPSIDGLAKTEDIPTKVSELTNDSGYLTEHQDISGKVDKVEGKSLISDTEIARLATVDNYDDTDIRTELANKADATAIPSKVSVLENDSKYQTESDVTTTLTDYATKTYVGEQITNAEHLKREIVTVLPSDTEASDNIIYMLKVESATGNDKYQEYMKIDGTVQMVGDTSVDLTDYAKTVEIPTTVAELTDSSSYAKTADIPTTLPANGGNANTVNNHTVKSDVPENAVFTDTIYDDTEVKESITELNSNLGASNAGAHNAIYRGKDLTNVYTKDQIYAMINAGTFDDLFIGDFFDIVIAGEGGNETVRCILAGFDTYLHNGDASFEAHHAVIVTKNCLTTTHGINPTSTTEGGFQGSDMWNTVLPIYNTAFGNVFGSHLLSHKTLLTNSISASGASMAGAGYTGYSNNWSWVDTKLSLLSEIQVYGVNVFSSSFFDTGCDNLQLPLFALDPTAKACRKGGTANADASNRQWYWLRNVASATHFAGVYYHGNVELSNPSYSLGVRPLFCIG